MASGVYGSTLYVVTVPVVSLCLRLLRVETLLPPESIPPLTDPGLDCVALNFKITILSTIPSIP